MRMRGGFLGAMLAGMGMMAAAPASPIVISTVPEFVRPGRATRVPRRGMVLAQPRRMRSRWKAQRRRLKRNMNHVSRRVRRRHRRAR